MSSQTIPDFNQLNAMTSDFFKKTSQSWMDMLNQSMTGAGNSWPAMEVLKQWSPLYNGTLNNANGQKEAIQKMLAACLEQQKLYSDLTKSGFDCATKTMEALRAGVQKQNDLNETLKTCQEVAADYCRSCASFIESEYGQICQTLGSPEAKKEEKTSAAKSKSQA